MLMATINSSYLHAGCRYCVRKDHHAAFVGHPYIASRVPALLSLCCPSTVSWLVVTIIVDTINGMLRRWLRPHILKERREGIPPPFANLYASSAVILPREAFSVFASDDNRTPDTILWHSLILPRRAVYGATSYQQVAVQAAAGTGFPSSHISQSQYAYLAAFAKTLEATGMGSWLNFFNDSPAPKDRALGYNKSYWHVRSSFDRTCWPSSVCSGGGLFDGITLEYQREGVKRER